MTRTSTDEHGRTRTAAGGRMLYRALVNCALALAAFTGAFAGEGDDRPGVEIPPPGYRHWQAPFKPLDLIGAYNSVVIRKQGGRKTLELWWNDWVGEKAEGRMVVVHRGESLEKMGPPETAFDGRLITDVFDPKDPKQLAPSRGMTRPYVTFHGDVGYIAMMCVVVDYKPGTFPLLPALAVSKDGKPGTWKYLGKLTGDPAKEAAARYIWSDGGSIFRLPSGKWRMYLKGYSKTLCAAESDALEGPWLFLRDDKGAIRELAEAFPLGPKTRNGSCFPNVLQVSDTEWHLWLSDQWTPHTIWRLTSRDGLTWELFGEQPEIGRAAVGGQAIKCLRGFYDPDENKIIGLLSGWKNMPDGKHAWRLYQSWTPPGTAAPATK